MKAGFAYNVIPSEVLIEGTIRALEDVRQELAKRIGEIAGATAKAFRGAEYRNDLGVRLLLSMMPVWLNWQRTVPGTWWEMIWSLTIWMHRNMGGEDFAYYLEKAPGAFMFLKLIQPGETHGCTAPQSAF